MEQIDKEQIQECTAEIIIVLLHVLIIVSTIISVYYHVTA